LTEELIDEARLGEGVAHRLLGDLASRSARLEEELAEAGSGLAPRATGRLRSQG
jgi:hypothetical protein